MAQTATTATRRAIWIGSLADYNAGNLLGEWVDVDGKDADDLQAEADRILETSREPYAEEFAIFDNEGFGGWVEEYTPLADVAEFSAQIDAAVETVCEHAFIAWIRYHGKDDLPEEISDYAQRFYDQYAGHYSSAADFAQEFAEMTGSLESVPEDIAFYIDWERYADHVLRDNGYHFEEAGSPEYGFYVFSPAD